MATAALATHNHFIYTTGKKKRTPTFKYASPPPPPPPQGNLKAGRGKKGKSRVKKDGGMIVLCGGGGCGGGGCGGGCGGCGG
ncbi:unnamed protein product [Ilex paraguariensis]|uniref:Uncharacterized protein n=1 Tax=Ilex paraguariensis TaxID=185542 RepID=A0ABC8S9S0_9AQUA